MLNVILIFLGAGFGGVLRYAVSDLVHWILPKHFPFGTLIVNISGCFLMGLWVAMILHRFKGEAPLLTSFLLIGLLGGYTTFSSFSLETVSLFASGARVSSFLYLLLSVVLCITAVFAGQALVRHQ